LGELALTKNKDEKTFFDGISFFTQNDLFKKKGSRYLLKVFSLSFVLMFIIAFIFSTKDGATSYFLSLIASALIIKGYDEEINK
jgi:hypothetical protein